MRDVYINEVANLKLKLKIGKFLKRAFGSSLKKVAKAVKGLLKDPISLATIFVPGTTGTVLSILGSVLGDKKKVKDIDPLQILAMIRAEQAMRRWERYAKEMVKTGQQMIATSQSFLPVIRSSTEVIQQQMLPTYQEMAGAKPLSERMEDAANWIFG